MTAARIRRASAGPLRAATGHENHCQEKRKFDDARIRAANASRATGASMATSDVTRRKIQCRRWRSGDFSMVTECVAAARGLRRHWRRIRNSTPKARPAAPTRTTIKKSGAGTASRASVIPQRPRFDRRCRRPTIRIDRRFACPWSTTRSRPRRAGCGRNRCFRRVGRRGSLLRGWHTLREL